MKPHAIHLAVLLLLLAGSMLASNQIFDAVLMVEAPIIPLREFSKIEIGENSIFAEVVRSENSKQKGLAHREFLGRENGMLFVFDEHDYPAIWMKDMKFPLDIIWISGNRVVDFEEDVTVPTAGTPDAALAIYRPDVRANLVLEVEAGFIRENNIRIGMGLALITQEELELANEKKILANRKEQLKFLRSLIAKEELTVEAMRKRVYNGSDFTIVKTLNENAFYTNYQISYKSDNLFISGVMNVPKAGKPPYPVIILNHGYIDPKEYTLGRGSRREQDYFARQGYITIHSDYRGYGKSSQDPSAFYDFNVGYTVDIMNLMEALKKFRSNIIDMARVGMWGHSMGGGVTERIMVLRNDISAYALFAPISANAADNIYLVQGKITDIEKDYAGTQNFEKFLRDISPYYYMSAVSAPVIIHHGVKDAVVPVGFSKILHKTLLKNKKTSLFFTYDGEAHEFIKKWPLAMTRSVSFFDQFVKSPKILKNIRKP